MDVASLEIKSRKNNVSAEEWRTRVDLAAAYRLVALFKWDDLVFTHISARVPAVHDEFLNAFSHALHGVFLWGMLMAVVPFGLAWLLKEVPLRTTLGRPVELATQEAAAGATGSESIAEPVAKTAAAR